MTKAKNQESEIVETTEPIETTETTVDGTGISADSIEETQAETLPPVVMEGDEAGSEGAGSLDQPTNLDQIKTTAEDCEVLYGVIMETAHGMAKKKGKGHRGLPEARRKAQGKLLHSICEKYNIVIPTEFELVIFGGALIADWQYMTIDGDKEQNESESESESESTPVVLEGETEQ